MMGYARRDYGLIGMATEELDSGCSRKDAATEAFPAGTDGVKHGHFIVIRSTPYEQLCPLALWHWLTIPHDASWCRAVAAE
jgi:hypothetical protein